ncbi:CO dehydrogenase flavoprotein C-terminal domain [Acididesulfobacillus acetoxydans]|uniref:CO dehydrogenase flavoprotein C-terminal domain n=1 Tax=Acididesulfobacillus acetoxydans TaxID=1561005 RepID=A0A8S0W5B7_9FIRM|nr:xanthine dehydrogenase subunit XdhB [Acididesulfobacillus acetoxydans]CAA7602998.1 CO dehydrogenase flavoprotein C-terminal domain [Acididesulfobacillus acetoxydans]CEJ05880.1 Xanthine dehydrogenase FAD-binding subunit [Acididesulfobacillus acetoxydans]
MFNIAKYDEAGSLDEALAFLSGHPAAKVIAGGTDVLIKMQNGKMGEAELFSIRGLAELTGIKRTADGAIFLGPLTTFAQIAGDPLLQKAIPVLIQAAVSMGGPQIRNIATIGGNICNGAVSADSAPTLLALNAELRLQSAGGERKVPLREFYLGPGKVDLRPGELLIGIIVRPQDYLGYHGHYIKFAMRKAMDIATLGVSVLCRVEAGGVLSGVRIALGVAAPTPVRCPEAEAFAEGKTGSDETLEEIGKLAVRSAKARTSWRASKEYREHLVAELVPRALKEAMRTAGGEEHV